jgi:Flp pilus assembly protein TadB
MDQQALLLIFGAGLAIFMVTFALAMPRTKKQGNSMNLPSSTQFRPRSAGKGKVFESLAEAGVKRALKRDSVNDRYLRQLKQANWYWEVGEPSPPNIKAPFWNVETLWGEKLIGALLGGIIAFILCILVGLVLSVLRGMSVSTFIFIGVAVAGFVAFMAYSNPDSQLAGAAGKRQRELTLEMGFRIPELRADVLSGATIQRAIRGMARRPGGPFVEELRRAVAVLDVTRDDAQAMEYMLDRNAGNELMSEFANSVKMVSRQGGQIGPVLNVIADLAQERLRLTISNQARKNLNEMTRPIALSSLIVTTLLIIVPALSGLTQEFFR